MVRGGGWPAGGKKLKLGVRGKKGKDKKEENYTKKGRKGLKNASFWTINSGGFFRPPPPCRLNRGGGGMVKIHNIYPCNYPPDPIFKTSSTYSKSRRRQIEDSLLL